MMPKDYGDRQMAFSFAKAFLQAFLPPSAKQGPGLTEYYQQLPEQTPAEAQQEAENDFLLSEWEKEDRRREREEKQEIPEALPVSQEEGFLEGGQWVFASRSSHVNAGKYDAAGAKYDRLSETLTIQYHRGDTWEYDPISPVLASKLFRELIDGSPGTFVWDHLRWRPSEGAPDMRSHRPWINARKIAGAAEED